MLALTIRDSGLLGGPGFKPVPPVFSSALSFRARENELRCEMESLWEGLWREVAVYFLLWCFLFGLLLLFMRGSHTIDDDENFSPLPTAKRDAGASVKTSI